MGECWDNVIVEGFFGGLKHDWMFNVAQPTREFMKHYNLERGHSANNDLSPIAFENA